MALLLNAGDTVSRSYSYTQPSPLHPSLPQECGDRTGNMLFTTNVDSTINGITCKRNADGSYTFSGTLNSSMANFRISGTGEDFSNQSIFAGTYTSTAVGGTLKCFMIFGGSHSTAGIGYREFKNDNPYTFTCDSGTIGFLLVRVVASLNTPVTIYPMLNKGSTALPYEPYGYKIPISSASTTTPVYLGEVETTRKIKKLVLTGEETIPNNDGASYNSETSTDRFVRDIPLSVGDNGISEIVLCTHLGFQAQSWAARTKTGCCIYCSGSTMQLHLRFDNNTLGVTQSDTNEQRTAKLKAYLAQQYAAGTPVTVWYVLATPTTGIVNEPICKIGDYADTVSGITIPTITGADSFDVLTTLKPSEVTVNYKGWHDATVKEYDGTIWQ